MKTKLSVLSIIIGALVCSSAIAAPPGKASVKDGWLLKNLSMVKLAPNEHSYVQRVKHSADGLKLNISWDVWSNDTANKASVLLNGSSVWSGSGNIKTAPISIKKGGEYKLTVQLCNDDGCSQSDPLDMMVVDTNGNGSPVLDAPLQDKNKPFNNSSGKVVGTYYTEWSRYGRHFTVDKIPAQNLTHILYGFVPICGPNDSLRIEGMENSFQTLKKSCQGQPDYTVTIHDLDAALGYSEKLGGNFGQIIAMKKAHPNLKILPSIGGWTLSDPFFDMHDAKKRFTFIQSVKEYLKTWKFFDGVDIDWEFPGGGGANPALGNAHDKQTYTLLMKELRAMLDELGQTEHRTYELTSAIGAGVEKIAAVDYSAAQQYMDYIFLMNYDFAGHFDLKNLNHQTSLNTQNNIGTTSIHSTEKAVDALLKQHVNPEKLVVGVAEYGRAWSGVHNYKPGQPFTGTASGPMIGKALGADAKGVLLYSEIVNHYSSGDYKTFYDAKAQAAWIFNDKTGELISYDNPRSVEAKGQFVNKNNLGGLFSWEIGNSNGDLLNAMHEGLGHGEGNTNTVNKPPVSIAGKPQMVKVGDTVTLDGSSSYDPEGSELNYTWEKIAEDSYEPVVIDNPHAAVTHFIVPENLQNNTLSFKLTVTDDHGHTASQFTTVMVKSDDVNKNQPPVSDAGHNQTVKGGTLIKLDGSSSHDPDKAPDVLQFNWTQLKGPHVVLSDMNSAQPIFTTPVSKQDQELVFELKVSDGKDSNTSNVTILVKAEKQDVIVNKAPVAKAGAAQMVEGNTRVELDGTQSYDDDNAPMPLSYEWKQSGGTPVSLANANSAHPSFVAPALKAGETLTFTLTVFDGQLRHSSNTTVQVKSLKQEDKNIAPIADAGRDQTVASNDIVILDGSASNDVNHDVLTYKWSQSSGPAVKLSNTNSAQVSFNAPVSIKGESLTFTLKVSDGKLSDSDSVTVTVKPAQGDNNSIAAFTPGQAYVIGNKVIYKGKVYRCIQAHTGATHWAPDLAVSLWVAE